MARAPDNPDRNFSADGDPEDLVRLKNELGETSPALPYNEAAKVRIGKVISDAVLPSWMRAPARRVASR